MSGRQLAERLLAAGIPVIAVGPGDIPRQAGWQHLTPADCKLSLFRPGDALAMVGGHGIDAVDVDTKIGGSVDNLPPFKSFGMTRTPSGGQHYIVPSSGLGKISPLTTDHGPVGDYVGGRPDGGGRLLLFLPGSVRSTYPDGGYVEEVPWDVEACLAAEPDPDLTFALENAGGGREAAVDAYVDDSPERDAKLGSHPYAAAVVEREIARLDECDLLGWDGPGWDNTSFSVACNLLEIANSNWSGFTQEQAHEGFLDHVPSDELFGPADHAAKWASAIRTVGWGARRCPDSSAADDFSEPVEAHDDPLFDATPVLAHVRQAAHSRMVSAPALLCYVLGRVLAEVPPGVDLPPTIGSRAALNLGIAVVGESGAGKSALLSVSRELMGLSGMYQEDIERNVGSGEGLVQTFLRYTKESGNVLIDDPRRILSVDEVDALGATQSRNGSTVAPTIRTAVSGGSLGQENATADRRRHVRANAYRLVLLIGVQPTRSATLLDDDRAGTPQRLVWVKATDPTIPDEFVGWPGPLADGGWNLPNKLPEAIDYPDHIKAEVRAARLRQTRGGANAVEASNRGHMLLTRLKVGAALALLHGESYLTEQWWALAGLIVRDSMEIQEWCRKQLADEAGKKTETRARAAGHAAVITAEVVDADRAGVVRASKAILKKVAAAGADGISWSDARAAVQHTDRDAYAVKARNALESGALIRVEDVSVGKRQGERLWATDV